MSERFAGIWERPHTLIVSQVVSQASLVLATPVLTRLVSVSEMGLYQVAVSISLVVLPLATLRTEYTIPLSPDIRDLRRNNKVAAIWTALVAAFVMVGAFAAHVRDPGQGLDLAVAAGMIVVAYALTVVKNAEIIRYGSFATLAKKNVLTGLAGAVLQVVFALVFPVAVSLALGLLVGRLIAQLAIRLPSGVVLEPITPALRSPQQTYARMIGAIGSGVLGNASSQGLVVFAGASYGAAAAGQVGISQRIVGAPTSLIGQGISQLVMGRASKVVREGGANLMAVLRPTIFRLFALSLALAVVIAAAAPALTPIVLGNNWSGAGRLMAVLALPLSLQLATVPLASVFMLTARERLLFVLQLGRLLGIALSVLCGWLLTFSLFETICLVSAVWTLGYCAFLVGVVVAIRSYDRNASAHASLA